MLFESEKHNLIAHSVCPTIVYFMFIAVFVLTLISRRKLTTFKNEFEDYVGSWENDMVFDITTSSTLPVKYSPDQFYITPWQGKYSGNRAGCNCLIGSEYVESGMKERECNFTEIASNLCDKIPAISSKDLKIWKNGISFYAVRGKDTDFLSNFDKMQSDGTCKEGYQNCGNKDSISKGACIKNTFDECPITNIKNAIFDGATKKITEVSGLDFFISNAQNQNPVSSLDISEHHVCFQRQRFAVTPGRPIYPLFDGERKKCIQDTTAWTIDKWPEEDFFEANNIDIKALINYRLNDAYKYHMFVGRILNWNFKCNDLVLPFIEKEKDLATLEKNMLVLFILSLIAMILSKGVLTQFHVSVLREASKNILILWFVIRLVLFIIVFPLLVVVIARLARLKSFFNDILTQSCTGEIIIIAFESIHNQFNKEILIPNFVSLGLILGVTIPEMAAYACVIYLE